jgi:hypothetical protein
VVPAACDAGEEYLGALRRVRAAIVRFLKFYAWGEFKKNVWSPPVFLWVSCWFYGMGYPFNDGWILEVFVGKLLFLNG